MDGKPLRLRDQVHAVIRVNHYSIRTEKPTGTGFASSSVSTR